MARKPDNKPDKVPVKKPAKSRGPGTSRDVQPDDRGETVSGMDVVDKIVSVERDGNNRPLQPQVIEKTWVVLKAQD